METLHSQLCHDFDTQLNRVLDGELAHSVLATDSHLVACAECRSALVAVRVLLQGLSERSEVEPPLGFAERVVPVILAERKSARDSRWTYRVAIGSLAASVLFAVAIAAPWRTPSNGANPAVASLTPTRGAPSVSKSFADAGSAFVALTKRAANQTYTPAKKLFALPEVPPALPVRPAVPSLGESVPVSASSIQPISNTARRAINLFIRDVGSLTALDSKMKS